eukprot:3301203-Rhodomonas_salina.1
MSVPWCFALRALEIAPLVAPYARLVLRGTMYEASTEYSSELLPFSTGQYDALGSYRAAKTRHSVILCSTIHRSGVPDMQTPSEINSINQFCWYCLYADSGLLPLISQCRTLPGTHERQLYRGGVVIVAPGKSIAYVSTEDLVAAA